jgi:phage/plasmid-like protein (TIGR03299 family)
MLGVVGDMYSIIQNRDDFSFVDAILQAKDGSHYESAGSLFGGKQVWCLARIPDEIRLAGDVHQHFLLFVNRHDGRKCAICKLVETRVVCNNTIQIALGEAGECIKIRHYPTEIEKVTEAREFVEKISNKITGIGKLYNKLAQTKLNAKTLDKVINSILGKSKIGLEKAVIVKNIIAYNDGNAFPEQANTAYCLLNSFTRYIDHVAVNKFKAKDNQESDDVARARGAMFGAGELLKFSVLQTIAKAFAPDFVNVI